MRERFEELRRRLAEINDIARAGSILGWDQQTMMPPRGAAVRAEQLATLSRIAHDKFTSPELGRLLEDLAEFEQEHEYDSFEASLIRVVRRDWEKARKVPTELRAEIARSSSLALPVWIEARTNDDFGKFLPSLRQNLELRRRYIECFDGDYAEPYDAVLDDYERDMRSSEVRRLFDYLKEHQAPIVREVGQVDGLPEPPARPFPLELQKTFELEVVRRFGYDDTAWRLDPTVHPFATGAGIEDIRLTTRYFDDRLDGLFATMHEFGHGLYEHQVDPSFERSALARGTSLGVHESQSRMWENLVGRSLPFWHFFFPRLQQAFPQQLGSVDTETFYRAVNRVYPSLIRIESDEVTYNMHIILRFELEQELVAGTVDPASLPKAWNERMREYLGVEVPDNRRGVLQDVHWSAGTIGYFPTYSLGNVISVQIWEKVRDEIPDLDEQFERGEFNGLREWLGERLHRHGRKFTPVETVEKVVGGPIDPGPYLAYLNEKHGAAQPA